MESFITEIDILDEAKDNFLTYAEEVLTDRAIPNAEDGLLSAQRKLLWTMNDYLKMDSKGKTKKCQGIVGSTLTTSYFHGDASCYGVLCKMSQEYLMRYPLVIGQGGLGTQEDNSMVASARYTEAKPSVYADLMFNDFKKDVVPLKETYNGEYMEPVILPSLFPNALVNGREAIGISMAHGSLPNNLTEVCDGIVAYIQAHGNIDTKGLMEYIKGPDFPLPNTVINKDDIFTAYNTGKSAVSLKVRGEYEVKGQEVIFTSIPYRTYRNKIKEQINSNVDELEKVIDDFNDESSVGVNRLVFKVKNGVPIKKAVDTLFRLTDLQSTVSYNMNFIINGTPQLCSLKTLIKAYVEHQIDVLLKATQYDKEKAEARYHILEGLIIALDKIDAVIELIRGSNNKEQARESLKTFLSIDDIQANAILDMKLARLTKMDKDELTAEKDEKAKIIAECKNIIEDEEHRNNVLIKKIQELKAKYGDERRTKLIQLDEPKEEKEIVNVIPEEVVITLTANGAVKRNAAKNYKIQKRNTKGTKLADVVQSVIRTNTIDHLLVFTDRGRMYSILADKIPEGKGTALSALIEFQVNEKPILIHNLAAGSEAKYICFATKQGMIKKTALSEYSSTNKKGIVAIKLKEDDSLVSVFLTNDEDIVVLTHQGMGIHFKSKEVAATGRATMGVKSITLKKDDEVVFAAPALDNTLAIFTENGLGKRVSLEELPVQSRAGKGIIVTKDTIAAGCFVNENDGVLVIGSNSNISIAVKELPKLSRTASGNIVIKNNRIVKVVRL